MKTRIVINLLFISVISLSISSCGIFKKAPEVETFEEFYFRFNSDTEFQLARIHFPIEGYHEDLQGRQNWTPENWVLHKAEISTVDKTQFKTSIKQDDKSYYEEVKALNGSLFFSRTFVKKGRQWELTKCYNIEG